MDRRPVEESVLWTLQVLTAAALAVDAYVHADLASQYDSVSKQVSQGTLFRAEAAAASLAALLVLVAGRRLVVWAFAFVVAAAGVGAVLLYRYVDVGTLGPLPNMYEPIWFTEKAASAIAEGVATASALAGFLTVYRIRRRRRALRRAG
ncbi:hypothetical protein ABH930_004634 [Kitasatospora sp. GAS204A]|uniref:hypothetical protein n=1 Tax=unclassified Kitasatospora TaxID=2633591 RepID=UPI0024735959|nr:hypothetical protein [Kitasatospora sp. GAS204B]MDH6120471.1 hypothetical protein [Kitasatospora sp. GAS204B]